MRVGAVVWRAGVTLGAWSDAHGFARAHLRRVLARPGNKSPPISPSLHVLCRLATACGVEPWQLLSPLSPAERKAGADAWEALTPGRWRR